LSTHEWRAFEPGLLGLRGVIAHSNSLELPLTDFVFNPGDSAIGKRYPPRELALRFQPIEL
jgi:hypothetical protein